MGLWICPVFRVFLSKIWNHKPGTKTKILFNYICKHTIYILTIVLSIFILLIILIHLKQLFYTMYRFYSALNLLFCGSNKWKVMWSSNCVLWLRSPKRPLQTLQHFRVLTPVLLVTSAVNSQWEYIDRADVCQKHTRFQLRKQNIRHICLQ